MGSGTQHPSELRSGPGTKRALTAKCFECSAAIRQRWLRPRFPSSSAPRRRRRVNTVNGPTGNRDEPLPLPTRIRERTLRAAAPIARPPPTTDPRDPGAARELPASPFPTAEPEAPTVPERHQQPPPTARGMQPPNAGRGPPLGAESSLERAAPTPRCAQAAPAPHPDGIAGPHSPGSVGGARREPRIAPRGTLPPLGQPALPRRAVPHAAAAPPAQRCSPRPDGTAYREPGAIRGAAPGGNTAEPGRRRAAAGGGAGRARSATRTWPRRHRAPRRDPPVSTRRSR